jgi:hypothetical protein
MFIARGATAQQMQRRTAGVPYSVAGARRNCDGISRPDLARLAIDLHPARSLCDEVNLLGFLVVVFLGAACDAQSGFGEALITDGGVTVGEQFPNFGPVFGRKRRHILEVLDVHKVVFVLGVIVGMIASGFNQALPGSGVCWHKGC